MLRDYNPNGYTWNVYTSDIAKTKFFDKFWLPKIQENEKLVMQREGKTVPAMKTNLGIRMYSKGALLEMRFRLGVDTDLGGTDREGTAKENSYMVWVMVLGGGLKEVTGCKAGSDDSDWEICPGKIVVQNRLTGQTSMVEAPICYIEEFSKMTGTSVIYDGAKNRILFRMLDHGVQRPACSTSVPLPKLPYDGDGGWRLLKTLDLATEKAGYLPAFGYLYPDSFRADNAYVKQKSGGSAVPFEGGPLYGQMYEPGTVLFDTFDVFNYTVSASVYGGHVYTSCTPADENTNGNTLRKCKADITVKQKEDYSYSINTSTTANICYTSSQGRSKSAKTLTYYRYNVEDGTIDFQTRRDGVVLPECNGSGKIPFPQL